MVKQILSDFNAQKTSAFKKSMKHNFFWIFYIFVYGGLFLSEPKNMKIFIPLIICVLVLNLVFSEMFPNTLPKTLHLCPLSQEEKETYVRQAYWVKVTIALSITFVITLFLCIIFRIPFLLSLCLILFHIEYILALNLMYFKDKDALHFLEELEEVNPSVWKKYHNWCYVIGGLLFLNGFSLYIFSAFANQEYGVFLNMQESKNVISNLGSKSEIIEFFYLFALMIFIMLIVSFMIKTYLPELAKVSAAYEKDDVLEMFDSYTLPAKKGNI